VAIKALSTGFCQGQSESATLKLSAQPSVQTRIGGDLLQIATGRFREAAESTLIYDNAGGALKKSKTPSAYKYGIFG